MIHISIRDVELFAAGFDQRRVALMGHHTDEILRELGVADNELAQLRASRVIHSGEPVAAGDD